VLKSDKDNDLIINKSEASTLALRIRVQLQEYGVEFDSEKFERAVGKEPSIPGVIAIVQRLLQPNKEIDVHDESEHNEELETEDDALFDMFYVAEVDLKKSVVGGKCNYEEGSDSDNNCPMLSRRVSLFTCDKARPSRRTSLLSCINESPRLCGG
jgi:hypothetical protein